LLYVGDLPAAAVGDARLGEADAMLLLSIPHARRGRTEDDDHADQLDAGQLEALAEPLRSNRYGKYFTWGSETKGDSVSQA
jgi:hypothetical protein